MVFGSRLYGFTRPFDATIYVIQFNRALPELPWRLLWP